jgi:GTP-binding protein
VDRGDLIVHLLDGSEGVTDQDAQILAYAFQRGKGLILAVNKWDLLAEEKKNKESFSKQVYRKLAFVDFAPNVFISALTGIGIPKLMNLVARVSTSQRQRIRTPLLNRVLRETFAKHSPPHHRGRAVKFFYSTQTSICPPTFMLFVNHPEGITSGYERYLIHQLRLDLDLGSSPIRLVLRGRRDEREGGKK